MVAYVDSNSVNRQNSPSVTTPAGTSGDILLALAFGYSTNSHDGSPDIWTTGAGKADFTKRARTTTAFSLSAVEAYERTTDGTEDASYGGALGSDAYGGSFALVRITEGQLQTTSGGVYTVTGADSHRVPAHTVDTNGSLAIFLGFGYNQAISDAALLADGWTQRETGDSNFFCIYTKAVNAGSYSAVTATSDGSGADMLLIYEPTAPPATEPGAPTSVSGTAGDTQVVLTWTAPPDGGASITDYVVQYRPIL